MQALKKSGARCIQGMLTGLSDDSEEEAWPSKRAKKASSENGDVPSLKGIDLIMTLKGDALKKYLEALYDSIYHLTLYNVHSHQFYGWGNLAIISES